MKPIQASDLGSLAAIWADPEVTRFLPSRGVPISRERVEETLASFIEHWKQRSYGVWAIVEGSSSMIGYCGLRYLQELDEVEVVYGLAKTYWGQGIATQATQAAIAYGCDIVQLDRINCSSITRQSRFNQGDRESGFALRETTTDLQLEWFLLL